MPGDRVWKPSTPPREGIGGANPQGSGHRQVVELALMNEQIGAMLPATERGLKRLPDDGVAS